MIDTHMHVFPPDLKNDPRQWAAIRGELHWAETVAPRERPSLQGWADIDRCLAAMDAAGIEKGVLLGWYWQTPSACHWHNQLMASWQDQYPERFIWFASVAMSQRPEALNANLQRALDLGAAGVGELHAGAQGFNYTDDQWLCLCEWCRQHNWPVNLHVTDPSGKNYPGRAETPLAPILTMLAKHPQMRVILAHLGGGMALDPGLRLPANCLLDSAAMPWLYPLDQLRTALQNGYAQQLCFGSDFPLRLYPRTNPSASLKRFASEVRDALPADALNAVTAGNFLRFIDFKTDR